MGTPEYLGKIKTERKQGSEPFRVGVKSLDYDLLDFWRWSCSDLIGNTTRGILAEYIVARALDIDGGVRDGWTPYDLVTPEGIKVEVKSSAYLQGWHQKKLSTILFGVRRTRAWDAETNLLADDAGRKSDVYVFALLAHKDKSTIDPLDLSQWEFYVVPTSILNERANTRATLSLKTLQNWTTAVRFHELKSAVQEAFCG